MRQYLIRSVVVVALLSCSASHAAFKAGPDGLPESWKLFRINEKDRKSTRLNSSH